MSKTAGAIRAGRAFVDLFAQVQAVAGRIDLPEDWFSLPLEEV
jgi:hypothetical protein